MYCKYKFNRNITLILGFLLSQDMFKVAPTFYQLCCRHLISKDMTSVSTDGQFEICTQMYTSLHY